MRLTGNIPKLSIVIPVFNVEKYIRECLDSILHQSFQEFELLLIDDGSSDQSGIICDEYAAHDTRISVFHTINRGQAAARNLGIENSKGDFIGFVDSDDWIDPTMYEKLIEESYRTGCEIVACNFHVMDAKGKFSLYNNIPISQVYSKDEAMKELIHNSILTFSPCNKIYKRTLFKDIRFREGMILEDMDISYHLAYSSNGVAYLKDGLYFYRYNRNSTLRSKFSLKRMDEYHVIRDMYDFYRVFYPEESLFVYKNLVFTGVDLYLQFQETFGNSEKKPPDYLISIDRRLLSNILFRKEFDITPKEKLIILLFIVSPKFYVRIKEIFNKGRHLIIRLVHIE